MATSERFGARPVKEGYARRHDGYPLASLRLVLTVTRAVAESAKSPLVLAGVRSLRVLGADDVGVVVQLENGDLVPVLELRDVLARCFTSTLVGRATPHDRFTPERARRSSISTIER
jgi:hypothetical protein